MLAYMQSRPDIMEKLTLPQVPATRAAGPPAVRRTKKSLPTISEVPVPPTDSTDSRRQKSGDLLAQSDGAQPAERSARTSTSQADSMPAIHLTSGNSSSSSAIPAPTARAARVSAREAQKADSLPRPSSKARSQSKGTSTTATTVEAGTEQSQTAQAPAKGKKMQGAKAQQRKGTMRPASSTPKANIPDDQDHDENEYEVDRVVGHYRNPEVSRIQGVYNITRLLI